MLARREWISLPYELARESGPRLDPMSLQEERDHLVTGLALRQPRRRTVITPRLASIPKSFIKSVFVFVNLVQPSVTSRANARHIVLPEQIQSSIYPGAAFSSNLVRRRTYNPEKPNQPDNKCRDSNRRHRPCNRGI